MKAALSLSISHTSHMPTKTNAVTNKNTNQNETNLPQYELFQFFFYVIFLKNRSTFSEGDNRNQMSPESVKVTLSSSAGFPADRPRPNSQSRFPSTIIPNHNNRPVPYQRSPDYPDTTNNQNPHYDSEHSQTISLKTGFRYNNPYANSNNDNNIPTTKNSNQNYTQHHHQTNDARHQTNQNNNHDATSQRQKILDFIVSDTQPQSFQSPTRTPLTANDIKLVNNAFVNSIQDLSSIIISTPSSIINTTSFKTPLASTTTRPRGIDVGSLHTPTSANVANDDSVRFVFNALHARRNPNRTQINNSYNNNEESDAPLYTRQQAHAPSTTTTSTTLVSRPRDEIVVPTTYAPLKNWKSQYVKKPFAPVTTLPLNTIANSHSDDKKPSTPFDEITFSTPVGQVTSKFSTPDYSRPSLPSGGTRQQSERFRESFNKTYETSTPSKYHVSPYTSLKSLLSEEPNKLSYRPTTVPPNNSSPPPLNPYRSYYIITAPPKKATTESTTHSPINAYTNSYDQTTRAPISITSSASTPVVNSNSDWTPINYNYNGRLPSTDSNRFKPTENSIDLDEVDMTTSHPLRNIFPSTYYPRPTTVPTTSTTPPSITTARIMLASTSERDHYRKIVRMRSKKKVNPASGQTINDDSDIIRGTPYGKPSGPFVNTNTDKNPYHHQQNKFPIIEISPNADSSFKHVDLSPDTPTKYYSNYRHVKDEKTLADYIQDHASGPHVIEEHEHYTQEPIGSSTGHGQDGLIELNQRQKFRATVEMPEFNIPTESEIKAKLKQLEAAAEKDIETEEHYETTTALSRKDSIDDTATVSPNDRTKDINDYNRRMTVASIGLGLAPQPPPPQTTIRMNTNLTIQTTTTQRTINSIHTIPPRASRVNAAIKTTIAAASLPPTRRSNTATTPTIRFATLPLLKCTDSTPNAKCNEIPSRYTNQSQIKIAPNCTMYLQIKNQKKKQKNKTRKNKINFLCAFIPPPGVSSRASASAFRQHAVHETFHLPK